MVQIVRVTAENTTEAAAAMATIYPGRTIDRAGLERALDNPDFLLLIARSESGAAGFVHGTLLDRVDGKRMLLIYDIEVVLGARRAGVGSALLAEARRVGRDGGAGKTWLVTGPDDGDAIGFYESLGGERFPAVGYRWTET